MPDWTSDANEVLTLSLVRASEDKESLAEDENYEEFHPAFTYPIYGEEEKIYGYSDLVVDLRFASGSLVQYLSVEYSSTLPASSTIDDVEGKLSEQITQGYLKDEAEFQARVEQDAIAFKPLGKLIYSYTRPSPSSKGKGKSLPSQLSPDSEDAVVFEAYHTTWETPGFREYHRRMQLFILLYIEGGSYIQEEEDQWEFVVLYEKRKRKNSPDVATYHFVGYSSLYNFYHYPEKVRLRLSQFVILPPYQRQGHGSQLYTAIYQYVLAQPHIAELTVEDPAEAFEDLRDQNDLKMLISQQQFMEEGFGASGSHGGGRVGGVGKGRRSGRGGVVKKGKMGPPTDKAWAEKWRKDFKIAGRQFHRLVEILLLLRLDPADQLSFKAFRLQVKERIYRFNYEIMSSMEKQERLEKLEETFQNIIEGYAKVLTMN